MATIEATPPSMLCRTTPSLVARVARLPEELAGRVEVSVGFLQRPLAVHHPRAGLLAQFFH
jgi:hypothetical protein